MDEITRILIRQWHAFPEDADIKNALDAKLMRINWLTAQMVEDIRFLSREILSHEQGTEAEIRAFAVRWENIDVGPRPSNFMHIMFELARGVFSHLPYPTFPEDRSQLNYPDAYDAAVRIAGCGGCLQYIQGCACGQGPDDYNYETEEEIYTTMYPFLCRDCNQRVRRANNQAGWTCGCAACQHCNQYPCGCGYHAQFVGPNIAITIHDNPALCSCYGSGWASTDYDSIHRCNIHPVTGHHPECEGDVPFEQCWCSSQIG